jgi:hypothetical protein
VALPPDKGSKINYKIVRDLGELDEGENTPQAQEYLEKFWGRYAVIDLHQILRRLDKALGALMPDYMKRATLRHDFATDHHTSAPAPSD